MSEEYVTRAELKDYLKPLSHNVNTIKIALLGTDLRSGLIKTVNNNCNEIRNQKKFCDNVQKNKKEKAASNLKLKLTAMALASSTATSVFLYLLNLFIG